MVNWLLARARDNRDPLTWMGFIVFGGWLFWLTVSLFAKGVLP